MSRPARAIPLDPALEDETPQARVLRLTHALADTHPAYSARWRTTVPQLLQLYIVLSLILAGLALFPALVMSLIVGALTLFYLMSFLFKTMLFGAGPAPAPQPEARQHADEALPIYTILVPLYREAEALPALVAGLARLDYPEDRLDIKFIVESDDAETARALASLTLPAAIEIIQVPPASPRTKPKALVYGLSFARGSFVVVYDAEDQPEPDQLRRALARFAELGPETACLQARLNFYNAREGWLCSLFAIDYCLWFDYYLPGLERLGAPIPLGGTSNHFRRSALIAAGAWDPFNVTEDADLGIRLAREGYRVRTLDSTTFEEAPPRFAPWLAQRARWIKGYLQTALVHSRDHRRLRREIGGRGILVLYVFLLGTALAGLVNPLLWVLFLSWLQSGHGVLSDLTGAPLLLVSFVGLVGGNALIVFLSLLAPLRRGWLWLVPFALTAPIYWLLISLAAWRGLLGLLLRPFHWAKTAHGLSRYTPGPAPGVPRNPA